MKVGYKLIEKNYFIELDNENGLKVYTSRVGASLYAIKYKDTFMLAKPEHTKDFFDINCLNGKLIENAIKDDPISIKKHGISFATFDVSNFHNKNGMGAVIFRLVPKKGYLNLPGNIIYQVAYTIKEDSSDLEVSINAMSSEDCSFDISYSTPIFLGEGVEKYHNDKKEIVLFNDKFQATITTDYDEIETYKDENIVNLSFKDKPGNRTITKQRELYTRNIRYSFIEKKEP